MDKHLLTFDGMAKRVFGPTARIDGSLGLLVVRLPGHVAEQPVPHVGDHGLQTVVPDLLAVDGPCSLEG
jgi:hypothetical protein